MKTTRIALILMSVLFTSKLLAQDLIEEIVVTGTKRDIGKKDAAIADSAITEQPFRNTFLNEK